MNDTLHSEGDKSSEQLDFIIQRRIQEAIEKVRQEIGEYDEAIKECEEDLAASPLPLKILNRLKPKKSPIEIRKKKLQEFRYILSNYKLPEIVRMVEKQIKLNRRSHQLYWLRKFLGDPTSAGKTNNPDFDFPYDTGDPYREDLAPNEYRRVYQTADEILKYIKSSATKGDRRSIVLYDTSDPSPQPRCEVVIDVLTQLDFAVDESARRGLAAMKADTGLDIHALYEFQGRNPFRPGHRMTDRDWIKGSDNSATGYLRIEGGPELCKSWGIGNLLTELTYERTALDTKLSLQVNKNQNVISVPFRQHSPRQKLITGK